MTSGFRTFTAGEVLTASNVQNYLMDQSVMTFAGSAARSSAIGTANFEEGMTSYLKDTDKLEVYNGTNWVGVAPTTTQGLTLINTTSFSAVASQSFTSIFSSTYDNYRIVVNISGNSANDGDQFLRLRSASTDATTNYQYSSFIKSANGTDQSFNSTTPTYIKLGAQDTSAVQGQAYSVDIVSPFLAQYTKFNCNVTLQTDAGVWCGGVVSGLNYNQTSYDGFTLHTQNGTFTGTASVYGYNK